MKTSNKHDQKIQEIVSAVKSTAKNWTVINTASDSWKKNWINKMIVLSVYQFSPKKVKHNKCKRCCITPLRLHECSDTFIIEGKKYIVNNNYIP